MDELNRTNNDIEEAAAAEETAQIAEDSVGEAAEETVVTVEEIVTEETADAAAEDAAEEEIPELSSEPIEYSLENKEYSADPDDLAREFELRTENAAKAKKKPFILQPTIIIACCILLVSLIAFGAVKVVQYINTPDIKGTWVLTNAYLEGYEDSGYEADGKAENEIYLSFTDDNVYEVKTGTVTYKYKWSYVDSDGNKTDAVTDKVMWYTEGDNAYEVSFTYEVEGSRLSERKLTTTGNTLLLNGYGMADEIDSFKSCDKTGSYTMEADKDFKAEEALLGKWENKEYSVTIDFGKDGMYTLSTPNNIQKGPYTVNSKDGTVQLKYYSFAEQATGDLSYEVKGDSLTVAGDEFKKVKE